MIVAISGSVGRGAMNGKFDVQTVQALLKERGFDSGPLDGVCGPKTIAAIVSFQKHFLHCPDGLITPNGPSWKRLTSSLRTRDLGLKAVTSGMWTGDSARWPEDKKLLSLNPIFRIKVQTVLARLRSRGFRPKIFYGWRSVAVQQDLFRRGRSKVRFSFHNAQRPDGTPDSWAADVVDERWGWEKPAEENGFWRALGEVAKSQGLVWGGDWKSLPDVAHIQGRQNSELAAVKRESGL